MANIVKLGGGGGSSTLITKSITQNGTYNAVDDSADGYSSVAVDVLSGDVLGVAFEDTLTAGQISTTSAYATATFDDISDYKYLFIKIYDTVGGTDYVAYRGVAVEAIPVSGNYVFTVELHRTITLALTRTSISSTQYGGDYYNIYADIVATKNEVFDTDYENAYVNISELDLYYTKNVTTPTITRASDYECSFSFTDQSASGYEQCSFSLPMTKGIYVAEIYATVNKNTGLTSQYTWGIYSTNTEAWSKPTNANMVSGYSTYVPFDRTDTNEHYYEIPINVLDDRTIYICFGMADDNGQNATVTVRSLKIRKAEYVETGVDYIESWTLKSQNSTTTVPTITTHITYTDGNISAFEVKENAGNANVVCGDVTTYIGDASSYLWKATATDDMTYRIYDIVNDTLSELRTATNGDVIVSGGSISSPYCVEIRRYS